MPELRTPLLRLAALCMLPGAAAGESVPIPQDPAREYEQRSAATPACRAGDSVVLAVATSEDAPLDVAYDAQAGRLRMRYRMAFNDVTEGWNWHPDDAAAGGDYYQFKFLPLGSVLEERGSYRGEDKIGTLQEFRVQWRYDYFFAFDNPYDFYARATDDAGFAADVEMTAEEAAQFARGGLRLALRGRLDDNCLSSSTTFWKATAARPVDFTLKKLYLVGSISEIWFYEAATGRIVARLGGASSAQR